MCDLTLNGQEGGCLAGDEKTRITINPSSEEFPAIYGDKIVWQDKRNGNWDIYMYKLSEEPIEPTCGNNIKEGNGECDGSDDSDCPGECNEECICKPIDVERPQSKIVNNEDFDVTGRMVLGLRSRDSDGGIINSTEVFDEEIIVPANGLIKLDVGKDSLGNQVFDGWNNVEVVSFGLLGPIEVYVSFEVDGELFEDSWEFEIV